MSYLWSSQFVSWSWHFVLFFFTLIPLQLLEDSNFRNVFSKLKLSKYLSLHLYCPIDRWFSQMARLFTIVWQIVFQNCVNSEAKVFSLVVFCFPPKNLSLVSQARRLSSPVAVAAHWGQKESQPKAGPGGGHKYNAKYVEGKMHRSFFLFIGVFFSVPKGPNEKWLYIRWNGNGDGKEINIKSTMECVFDGIMMMMMMIIWNWRSGIWSGLVGNQGLPDADPTFSPIISISPQKSKRF